jgi:hypothetical protein
MFTRAYGYQEGTFLYEQDRLLPCGLPKVRLRRTTPLSIAETINWARRMPRAAWQAQGFTRIRDFARQVKQLRQKRAELRKPKPDPVRRAILDRLERIMLDRADLRKAARREAKANCHPDFPVWWNGKKPRLYKGVRRARGYFPKRNVKVPATWVVARLDGSAANVAERMRQADPRKRILGTPHWINRVAAGALVCHDAWLTASEHTEVQTRARSIRALRCERQERRPQLELMRVKDITVIGSDATGFALWLGDRCVHRWRQRPSRAGIAQMAARERQRQKEAERHRAWRAAQERAIAPSPDAPDTLGWRGWRWDGQFLISPVQGTPWHDATMRVVEWADSAAVRGVAGIHARRLPCHWRRADPAATEIGRCNVHGIVERFGRYVLGTEGWRSEWVVIRELMAPDTETALTLMQRYPEVKVHVREQEKVYEDRRDRADRRAQNPDTSTHTAGDASGAYSIVVTANAAVKAASTREDALSDDPSIKEVVRRSALWVWA